VSNDGQCLYIFPILLGVLLRGYNQLVVSISGGKNQFKVNTKWSLVSIGGQYHNEVRINWFNIKMVVIIYWRSVSKESINWRLV
jgi:hypothetical protein